MPSRLQLTALFARFKTAADAEGAVHFNEVCRAREVEGLIGPPIYTVGCGGESKFYLPADGPDFKRTEPAKVCVVDDMAYEFPRYGG